MKGRRQNSGDRRQKKDDGRWMGKDRREEFRRQESGVRRLEIKEQVPGVRCQVSEAGHPVLMDSLLIDRRLPID